jgi:hypothetical protein
MKINNVVNDWFIEDIHKTVRGDWEIIIFNRLTKEYKTIFRSEEWVLRHLFRDFNF